MYASDSPPPIKKLFASIAGFTGARALSRRLTRDVPRLFMLHRFSSARQPGRMQVDDFVAFLRRVKGECEIVTVSDMLDRLAAGPRPARALAAITIDDGYRDFYDIALPVLAEMRIPATLYVTAGFVDGRYWPWWDALRFLLDGLPGRDIELETPRRRWRLALSRPSGLETAWSELSDAMVRDNPLRDQVLSRLQDAGSALPPDLPAELAPVTWDHLRETVTAGVEVGNHTMTHPFLPGLDNSELGDEITGARMLLEHRIGRKIRTFAYPNGMPQDHSPEVEKAVQAAGHASAVVAYPRRFDVANPFRIGRWSAGRADTRLEHILSGASALKLAWSTS